MYINKNQKGQALLFVVVAMTIALAVGVNVSVRTLSSASRVSSTDTYSRVLAAAEGGAERFIVKPISELNTLSSAGNCVGGYPGNPQTPPSQCEVRFEGTLEADPIDARAVMTVSTYNTNTSTNDRYELIVKKDTMIEVNMDGYTDSTIPLCWSVNGSGTGSDLYYIIYKDDGTLDIKQGIRTRDVGGSYIPVGFVDYNNGSTSGYSYCHDISGYDTGNIKRLRILAIGNDARLAVMTSSLPTQGYRIVSVGELVESGNITATKVVTVYRSFPYLPNVFDASIYTFGALN